jgi:citrate synthase
VDPNEGIRLRGFTIPELLELLPKDKSTEMPMVGGLYYLLLIGEIPSLDEALEVEDEWKSRWDIPAHLSDVLQAMPEDASPMTLFSQAILSLQGESIFSKKYSEGLQKSEYWEPMLEDSLNLTAKLPAIAALIYSLKHRDGQTEQQDPNLDWSANFAQMMEVADNDYQDLSRLYFIIHSDHESGNVSAHATHLVGSTLADIYFAASAGMNGLSGPLHGRANQEGEYAWNTLNAGHVIPGYGHAVLRTTDPRFTALLEFGQNHFLDDEIFDLARLVYEVVPGILREQGKAKNPWPNVDAISGTLQYHYGVDDCNEYGSCGFYTVLFGVSRILGVSSNAVWARAMGQPLERPKSLTTTVLEEIASQKG